MGDMIKNIRPILAILLSASFLLIGNGFQNIFLPLRAAHEEFSNFYIGALGSGYFLGFVLGCLCAPYLVKRAGHIRTFAAMVSLSSAVTLGHLIFIIPEVWVGLRIATGFCLATLYMVIESWLNDKADNKTRGAIMSAYLVTNLCSIMAGQMMIIPLSPTSMQVFLVASIVISLAAIPVAFTRSPQPTPPAVARLEFMRLYKISTTGLNGCFLVGLGHGSIWALSPVFAKNIGLPTQNIALFMSILVLGGAIFQTPIGYISDRFDRRSILGWISIGVAIAATPLWLFAEHLNLYTMYAAVFVLGGFAMPQYSVTVAHAFDRTPKGDYVNMSAMLLMTFGFGAVCGPLVASYLIDTIDAGALFMFILSTNFVLVVYLISRILQREAVVPEEKDQYDLADTTTIGQSPNTPFLEEPTS